jgi:hypothetical protein
MSKTVIGTHSVVRWGCNMVVPIGGRTGQLLCVGMDGAVALYGGSSVMGMQSGCSNWWQNSAGVVCVGARSQQIGNIRYDVRGLDVCLQTIKNAVDGV